MTRVHPNVTRVAAAAAQFGLAIEPRRFPEGTKTAADAAAAIGVDVGQIVKSLIFSVDGEVVLAYVSGANQLDETKLADAAGGAMCARVDADTVYEATGFPIARRVCPVAPRSRTRQRRHGDRPQARLSVRSLRLMSVDPYAGPELTNAAELWPRPVPRSGCSTQVWRT